MSGKYFGLVKNFMSLPVHRNNYMKPLSQARLLTADEGKVRVEVDVTEELTNPFGSLHGGCSATLIDIVTTLALIAHPKCAPGVSVDLHVSYLAGAKIGETIIVEGSVLKSGNKVAFTEGKIYNKSNNALVASGLHTKAFPPPKENK
uniref:4HBT domain-containing protein n=2 Tax=Rhabditophanes sp. KR3021 TaxID=114890 RepID=A0AC35U9L3_9BILA